MKGAGVDLNLEVDIIMSMLRRQKTPWIVVTGLDGAGKTTLVNQLAKEMTGKVKSFRLPFFKFVYEGLKISGNGVINGDVYTDRQIFALDARLVNYQIKSWKLENDVLISQRGWMDNYIHGKAQEFRYRQTSQILKINDLEKPDVIIYLIADPLTAWERIKDDPNKDKYEELWFLKLLYREIHKFRQSVQKGHLDLKYFYGIPNLLIDTSNMDEERVFKLAKEFLETASFYKF